MYIVVPSQMPNRAPVTLRPVTAWPQPGTSSERHRAPTGPTMWEVSLGVLGWVSWAVGRSGGRAIEWSTPGRAQPPDRRIARPPLFSSRHQYVQTSPLHGDRTLPHL